MGLVFDLRDERDTGVHCVPQHLEDLGKNILLATNVYLEFREDICWLDERLQQKIRSGEVRILQSGSGTAADS
jgi:hypothetical protein